MKTLHHATPEGEGEGVVLTPPADFLAYLNATENESQPSLDDDGPGFDFSEPAGGEEPPAEHDPLAEPKRGPRKLKPRGPRKAGETYSEPAGEVTRVLATPAGVLLLKSGRTLLRRGKETATLADVEIFPEAALVSSEGGSYVDLSIRTLSPTPQRVRIAFSSLTNTAAKGDDHDKLKAAGYPVGKKGLGHEMYALIAAATRAGTLPVIEGIERPGWTGDRKRHIRPGADGYIGTLPPVTAQAGTWEAWAQAVRRLVDLAPALGEVLAHGSGGLLRGLISTPDHSSMLLLHGEAGVGKTLSAQLAASMQGSPILGGGAIVGAGSTLVGAERLLESHNHGFLCVDEIHFLLAQAQDPVNRLMQLANGGGRAKGQTGGGVTFGAAWNASLILTGNVSLSSKWRGHPQADAIAARVIEWDTVQEPIYPFKDFELLERTRDVVTENHGHAYPRLLVFIEERQGEIRSVYEEFREWGKGVAGAEMPSHLARRLGALALAFAGAHVLHHVIGWGPQTAAEIDRRIMSRFELESAAHGEEMDNAEGNAKAQLEHVINALHGAMRYQYLALDLEDCKTSVKREEDGETKVTPDQRQIALAREHAGKVREVMGEIANQGPMEAPGDYRGKVYISTTAKDTVYKRTGVDLEILARTARGQGWLSVTESQAKSRKLTTKRRGMGYCYAFTL
jgi:hypothetical protein